MQEAISKIEEIGGYFELELSDYSDHFLHSDGILLNSGRHAFEYLLLTLLPGIKKIWLPYYTCDSLIQPLNRLRLPYNFYHIKRDLELREIPQLGEGEYIVITNYFGLKDTYVARLQEIYGGKIIIDQSQAWFAKDFKGIKSFYSPRKYFGVPDGGIAFGAARDKVNGMEQDMSWDRFQHLLKRHELPAGQGHKDFKRISQVLSESRVRKMSRLTRLLLSGINMERVKEKRKSNFHTLDMGLKNYNLFTAPDAESYECPMVYPFYTEHKDLRKRLIENKIYVATYWPNVLEWCKAGSDEVLLTENLIPLPVDQRYDSEAMQKIIEVILSKK